MSDNIQVAIRVRPLNAKESIETQGSKCIQINLHLNSILMTVSSSLKQFSYDYVADENASQEEIFEKIGKRISLNCLQGYNGTIFAYGQTGSGKTYTITGPASTPLTNKSSGILPRCINFIFSKISQNLQLSSDIEFLVKCSFLEIYNEQIRDLLSPHPRNLQIREDIKKGCYVEDLTEETTQNLEETMKYVEKGLGNRHTSCTLMNKESSRSHSVFTLLIESKEKKDGIWNFKNSLFHLIDLAGSERQKDAGTSGERLREASLINKSLSTLGDVINSLVEVSEGKNRYIRYRDSKLTFLLKDSIGGNSKTCIIANVTSSASSYAETLSTLRFAERAKLVKNKAVINEDTIGTINELKAEVLHLRQLLKADPSEIPLSSHRVRELEELLEKNTKIRLFTESGMQKELEAKENYIRELVTVIKKYELKLEDEKFVKRLKDEKISRLQKGEKLSENAYIEHLQQEMSVLRRENDNHPVAAKYFVENDALKHYIESLEQELAEHPSSMTSRLKTNQEFTEQLNLALDQSLKDKKSLESRLEAEHQKSLLLEEALQKAQDHINDLLIELETRQSKILMLEEKVNRVDKCFSQKKKAMKEIDLNIMTPEATKLSFFSGFRQNSFECVECLEKNSRIEEAERKIKYLMEAVDDFKYYHEESFRLGEAINSMKCEADCREVRIKELYSENDILLAENEELSAQVIHFSQQLAEKCEIIAGFSGNIRESAESCQDSGGFHAQFYLLQQKCSFLQSEYSKLANDMKISVVSRENMIEELKKLQQSEYLLQKESEELNLRLKESSQINERLKKDLDDLNKEIIRLTGHNNHSQKINYLAKIKQDYNTLKDSNTKLKEELRKKTEKLDKLGKMHEKLIKANGLTESAWESNEILRIEQLEATHKEASTALSKIHDLVSEFSAADANQSIEASVESMVKYFLSELHTKSSNIEQLVKELSRKDSITKVLENELLLYKQKSLLIYDM